MGTQRTLTPAAVIELYPGIAKCPGVLANWRAQGRGPKYYKAHRRIIYKPEDIEAFLFGKPVHTEDSIKKA